MVKGGMACGIIRRRGQRRKGRGIYRGGAGAQRHVRRAGEDFGDHRLVETVVSHRDQPAPVLLETIFGRVRQFAGGHFADDATLITIAIR